MSAEPTPHERRLRDLLADDALGALPEDEGTELGRLTAECPEVESQSYELAAAALHQALLPAELSPLPAELRRRLESDARTAAGAFPKTPPPWRPSPPPPPPPPPPCADRFGVVGSSGV